MGKSRRTIPEELLLLALDPTRADARAMRAKAEQYDPAWWVSASTSTRATVCIRACDSCEERRSFAMCGRRILRCLSIFTRSHSSYLIQLITTALHG